MAKTIIKLVNNVVATVRIGANSAGRKPPRWTRIFLRFAVDTFLLANSRSTFRCFLKARLSFFVS